MISANLLPIENALCVELKINNIATKKFSFPTDEVLKGKKVVAIEAIKHSNVSNTPMGETVINDAAFNKAFLTLSQKGVEKVKDLPLACLHTPSNNGLLKFFNDLEPDMTKSSISFSDTADLVKDEIVLLVFYFK